MCFVYVFIIVYQIIINVKITRVPRVRWRLVDGVRALEHSAEARVSGKLRELRWLTCAVSKTLAPRCYGIATREGGERERGTEGTGGRGPGGIK